MQDIEWFDYEGPKGFGYPSWKNNEGWTIRVATPLKEDDGSLYAVLVVFIKDNHVCAARNLIDGEESHCKEEHLIPQHVRDAADVILRRVMSKHDYVTLLRACGEPWNNAHSISKLDTLTDYEGAAQIYGRPQRWVRDWFERIENF